MLCIKLSEHFSSDAPWRFLISVVFVLDHFSAYPAITIIKVTGHQLITVCRSIGSEEQPHCDELVLLVFIIKYCFLLLVLLVAQQISLLTLMIFVSICQLIHAHLLFTRLVDVLSRLEQVEQRPFCAVPWFDDTSDTSGDESDMGEARRRLLSQKTYKMKKAWGDSNVEQFFVTGPADVATKPSHSYCRICRKDVSLLTHGHHKNLPHF